MLSEYQRARLGISCQIVAFLCVFGGIAIGGYLAVSASLIETITWDRAALEYPPGMLWITNCLRWTGAAIAGGACALGFAHRIIRIATLSKVSDV